MCASTDMAAAAQTDGDGCLFTTPQTPSRETPEHSLPPLPVMDDTKASTPTTPASVVLDTAATTAALNIAEHDYNDDDNDNDSDDDSISELYASDSDDSISIGSRRNLDEDDDEDDGLGAEAARFVMSLRPQSPLPSTNSSDSLSSIQTMPSPHPKRSRHDSLCFATPLKSAWVDSRQDCLALSPLGPRRQSRRRSQSLDQALASKLLANLLDEDCSNGSVGRETVNRIDHGSNSNPLPKHSIRSKLEDCKSWKGLRGLSPKPKLSKLDMPDVVSSRRDSNDFGVSAVGLRYRPSRKLRVDSIYAPLPSLGASDEYFPHSQRLSASVSRVRDRQFGGQTSDPTVFQPRTAYPQRGRWVIPIEHPLKILWDMLIVVLSFANAYATHTAIRDRKFGGMFNAICTMCFLIDIVLNFVTERRARGGKLLQDHMSICAKYLTSWFVVDALSVFPWETIYVQPIIDLQTRRNFLVKNFFRSKAVIMVTARLRSRHFRWFGKTARHTKQHGVGAIRLLRLIIKYLPKYLLFLKNMKAIVAVRILRQMNYFRRFLKNLRGPKKDDKGESETQSLSDDDDDLDGHSQTSDASSESDDWHRPRRYKYNTTNGGGSSRSWKRHPRRTVEVVYDDGVPL